MATNTFASVKPITAEQNARPPYFPSIGTRFFNGSKTLSGTTKDASAVALSGRKITLMTAALVLIDQTTSDASGNWSFPNLRNDINDLADGLVVAKQRTGVDGYAQLRDRLSVT